MGGRSSTADHLPPTFSEDGGLGTLTRKPTPVQFICFSSVVRTAIFVSTGMGSGAVRLPTKPHFFKPLLPGFLHEFVIPIDFFTQYLGGDPDGQDQCTVGVLRSSSGKSFQVAINGRRLGSGWPEFATEHELHVGDFVVFGHEGGLVFDVRVFDLSACERVFPRSGDPGEEAGCQSLPIVVEDDSDAEPMGPAEFSVSERTMKNRNCIIQHKAAVASFPNHSNHPSFVQNLGHTNIEKSILYLPNQFSKKNDLHKKLREMILRDEKGRSWDVKLGHNKDNHRVYIGRGFRKFVIANDLKIGDYLRFELVQNGAKPVANIYVFERGE